MLPVLLEGGGAVLAQGLRPWFPGLEFAIDKAKR